MPDLGPVTTSLNVLLAPAEQAGVAAKLAAAGFEDCQFVETVFACEPDNMLVAEYQQLHGSAPVTEVLSRLVVLSHQPAAARLWEVTAAVVAALPAGTLWYGTSTAGDCRAESVAISQTCAIN